MISTVLILSLLFVGCTTQKQSTPPAKGEEQAASPANAVPNSAEDCYKLEGAGQGGQADKCYENLAVEKRDEGICQRIVAGITGYDCFKKVAKIKNDVSVCDRMVNARTDKFIVPYTPEEKSWCAAFATGSTSYCNGLASKDVCIAEAATSSQDVSLCGQIAENSSFVGCVSSVAAARNDVSICDTKTNSKQGLGRCYAAVAFGNNRIELCGSIEDSAERNQCYYNFAVLTNIPSACDKMTGDWVESCKEMVRQNFG